MLRNNIKFDSKKGYVRGYVEVDLVRLLSGHKSRYLETSNLSEFTYSN